MTAKPSQHGNDAAKFVVFFNFKIFGKRTFKDFYIKYQNFQGPKPFSRTFQVLEKRKKFKDFQELSRPSGHPVCNIRPDNGAGPFTAD